MPATGTPRLVLQVRGLGHVPSLKNSMFAIVQREKREWKRRCVQSFVSQLRSHIATCATAIPTTPLPPCSTAWLPRNDTWKDIPQFSVTCVKVEPGEEGATIEIEVLTDS